MLLACVGLIISVNSCAPDGKDKDLPIELSFLETYDYSKWTLIQDEMRIYIRFNKDMDKAIEMWMSELEFEKLFGKDECFYYTAEMLNVENIKILENSEEKLEFSTKKNTTWTFTEEKQRLKFVVKTPDGIREPIYFSKTTESFNDLEICTDDSEKEAFDWKFLNTE